MDEFTKSNEQLLLCTICKEIFKDPCTLGCQHTFCKRCLTNYTKAHRDAITAKSIPCPTCSQMTKVPRSLQPVDHWCEQFEPSFIIQGLLDTFASPGSSAPVEHHCFACEQIGKTSNATSVCEDCNIMLCENCTAIHVACPNGSGHVIAPLRSGSTVQLKRREVMCKEHNCLVEFRCKDCQKSFCNICCSVYHWKCNSVVSLDSMIPEMTQVLKETYEKINTHVQQTEITLRSRRSEVEDITQGKSSQELEIRRVSQQAMDLIRRNEEKLLSQLETLTEQQTEQLRGQTEAGEIDLLTYRQYKEFITLVLQSNSTMDMFDMYTLCQSGEITDRLQRHAYCKGEDRVKRLLFERDMSSEKHDNSFRLGHLKYESHLKDSPCTARVGTLDDVQSSCKRNFEVLDTPILLSTISTRSTNDNKPQYPTDVAVINIGGIDTLVVTDNNNSSVKSCYTNDGKSHCTSLKLDKSPWTLTQISEDTVAVLFWAHNSIELIKFTPDPVLVSSIKTAKRYGCVTALSDKTLAAGCDDPPSIDVLDLSGRVLRSVITPSTGQQLVEGPLYMCTTRQGHIVVVDGGSQSVYCVTLQGKILFSYKLTVVDWVCGGVTTTDSGSVIVADYNGIKIVQLTETGEYVRDLLTVRDEITGPRGIRIHGNKLYVTEAWTEDVKVYQLKIPD